MEAHAGRDNLLLFFLLLLFGRQFDALEEQLRDTEVELDGGGTQIKEVWGAETVEGGQRRRKVASF